MTKDRSRSSSAEGGRRPSGDAPPGVDISEYTRERTYFDAPTPSGGCSREGAMGFVPRFYPGVRPALCERDFAQRSILVFELNANVCGLFAIVRGFKSHGGLP